MFGYIIPDQGGLDEGGKRRFREMYCGLCHVMYTRHGLMGTATLSNDLTFLAVLLNALYEPEEIRGESRCTAHPLRKQSFAYSDVFDYVADMNLALAYHKCEDNRMDDGSVVSACEARLLRHAYDRVKETHPQKCRAIEAWLDEIHQIEKMSDPGIDPPANSTGRLLGELFAVREDYWSGTLRRIGDGLGRFIYVMDAYDDLEADVRKHRFNPLIPMIGQECFETFVSDGLTMAVGESTAAFEELPVVQDADLIRNVLYSGIWSRYSRIQKKRQKTKE